MDYKYKSFKTSVGGEPYAGDPNSFQNFFTSSQLISKLKLLKIWIEKAILNQSTKKAWVSNLLLNFTPNYFEWNETEI